MKPQVYTISFHNLVISFGKVRVLREHKELLKVFMVPPIELTRWMLCVLLGKQDLFSWFHTCIRLIFPWCRHWRQIGIFAEGDAPSVTSVWQIVSWTGCWISLSHRWARALKFSVVFSNKDNRRRCQDFQFSKWQNHRWISFFHFQLSKFLGNKFQDLHFFWKNCQNYREKMSKFALFWEKSIIIGNFWVKISPNL